MRTSWRMKINGLNLSSVGVLYAYPIFYGFIFQSLRRLFIYPLAVQELLSPKEMDTVS